jgi:hypothetical protein
MVIHLNDGTNQADIRRNSFNYELGKFFKDYEVFPGIKKDPGHVGISESFKKLISENYNEPQLTIFEDDVKFTSSNSWELFTKAFISLPDNWDILLGGSYWFEEKEQVRNLIKVGDFCSLHCIIVRNKAYDHFLSHDPNIIPDIDRFLGSLSKKGILNVYLANPMIAVQHNGFSYHQGKNVNYDHLLKDKNILHSSNGK